MADDGDGWDDDDSPMFPPPPDDDDEATAPVTEGDAAILDCHRLVIHRYSMCDSERSGA
jgi:hypothetical protein